MITAIDILQTNHQIKALLFLADSNLIIAHKSSEWCGHAPILEQDIAISNIALDHLGQARNFYQYIALLINNQSENKKTTEDSLAYLRDTVDYKNLLITELPNGDFAQTILRIFFYSTYQYFLYQQLKNNSDDQISAIANKALKEVTYHVKWSGDWVLRLGDGTLESKQRVEKAIAYLWCYTGEFFSTVALQFLEINSTELEEKWLEKITTIFTEATLNIPENTFMQTGGFEGKHTEHLGFILAEMQYLQRTYPNAEW